MDLLKLRHLHRSGRLGGNNRVEISHLPIHPRLKASLGTVPVGQLLFLITQTGAGFTAGGFGNWFREACLSAGIENRSAHGLRKSAATRLADAGCPETQIKAVTGHTTSKEVERYTKARNQRLLA